MTTTIAVFVGSLRKDSINRRLARSMEALAPEGTEFVYANMDLPLYNQDLEEDFPDEVTRDKELVERADGVLFVTPENNRSYTAVIKNAIDWCSRPWGKNSFAGKSAAIAGATPGALGTTQAQQALRNVLLFLDMKVMGQPEMYFDTRTGFDPDGNLAPGSRDFVRGFTKAMVDHMIS